MIKIIIFLFLFFFGLTSSSYAYLDPGSVNIVLQFFALVLTGIITGWLFLKNYIKKIFNKIFKTKNKKDN